MKKIWKYLIAIAVLATAAIAATACTTWQPLAEKADEDGYTVSVMFDSNGGEITNNKGATIVDAFNISKYKVDADGMVSIKIMDLADPVRNAAGDFRATRTNYFLAGWYTERTPRVNENGEPLDEFGQLTSESGREQGWTYSGRWDFEKDRLRVDPTKEYTATEPQLTLYAAWIPEFTFDFYALGASGNFELIPDGEKSVVTLTAPQWNTDTGKLDMNGYPKLGDSTDKKTFVAAFMDEAMTIPAPATLNRSDYWDINYETGTATQFNLPIYTTWVDGEWFRIYTAEQFKENSKLDGCYELQADLDFDGVIWSKTLTTGEFTGTITSKPGSQFTMKNIHVIQSSNDMLDSGLFGILGATAEISHVRFDTISYTIENGSRKGNANFGLLAGSVREGATVDNVTIQNGSLILGACDLVLSNQGVQTNNIGLLFGSGSISGLSHDGIVCIPKEDTTPTFKIGVDDASGQVTLTPLPATPAN